MKRLKKAEDLGASHFGTRAISNMPKRLVITLSRKMNLPKWDAPEDLLWRRAFGAQKRRRR